VSLLRHIPVALTLFRLGLSVPLAFFLWSDRVFAALLLLVVAGTTDLLDGYLAREFSWRTSLGAWLDPAADKILITVSLVTLTAKGYLPLWFCLVTIGRDLGLVIGVTVLVLGGTRLRIRPLLTGKLATVFQNLTMLAAMLTPLHTRASTLIPAMVWVSTAMTVISSIAYARAIGEYRKAAGT
jgi:cardiolipin synthase (CMP-forming)